MRRARYSEAWVAFHFLPALAPLLFGAAAGAATISAGPTQDAAIFANSAGADSGTASGQGPGLFAGADGNGGIKRSLLAFDLSGVPSNATVTGVTLTLYLEQVAGTGGGSTGSGPASRQLGLYDLLQTWGEGASGSGMGLQGTGYPRQNGDSTWDYAFYNSNPALAVTWNSNGTGPHGGNASPAASVQTTFSTPFTVNTAYTWSSAGMVADVQNWVSGTTPNDGWLLRGDSTLEATKTSFLAFYSKEGAAAANNSSIAAPTLTVTYTVPEPAGSAVLGIGLALTTLARGRRAGRKRVP